MGEIDKDSAKTGINASATIVVWIKKGKSMLFLVNENNSRKANRKWIDDDDDGGENTTAKTGENTPFVWLERKKSSP